MTPGPGGGRGRGDGGTTLVEVLVATVLLGSAVVVLLTGLDVAGRSDLTEDRSARLLEQLVAATDAMGDPHRVPFAPCTAPGGDPLGAYQGALDAALGAAEPGAREVTVVAVDHWAPDTFTGDCPAIDTLQRITLRTEVGRTVELVKGAA